MSEKERQQAAGELLDYARTVCMVTPNMVARATGLQVPVRLVWCAAGAGLASYHKSINRVQDDIRAAFGSDAEQLPQAYFDGYKLETLREQYAL